MWSAFVEQSEPFAKWLHADAGSGIVFNLRGELTIEGEHLPEGVIMLPVQNTAEHIVLAPNAKLAGIRFHPAIGYGVLGQHYDKPTLLQPQQDHLYSLYPLYAELKNNGNNKSLVDSLYLWASNNLDITNAIPDDLEKALGSIEQYENLDQLSESISTSQRHIERHFKRWLGMTPKHYQRILRIKKTLSFLRLHQNANLADVAHQFGFSDQAHMTREFRVIARMTPGQI